MPAPEPVFFHGELRQVIAYRLPIKLLVFNIRNGRFAAELIEEEKRLNRKLDPTKDEDVKVIQHLLLEQNKGETDVLKDDLKKNGQLYPGIITFDGAVINANRRMAILQVLNKETGDERFEYLKVARLPKGVDAKDLWRIEAKLQFGREFRLEYGQVNELLKIRAGKNSGLSDKQISEALAGRYTEKEVGERLEVLKLMDTYLHRIGKPGEYKHIQEEQAGEKFNSLQANVISSLKKSAHKSEVPKITEIAFAMIEGKKHSHWKIRRLRKIAELSQARAALYAAYDKQDKLKSDRDVVLDSFDTADTGGQIGNRHSLLRLYLARRHRHKHGRGHAALSKLEYDTNGNALQLQRHHLVQFRALPVSLRRERAGRVFQRDQRAGGQRHVHFLRRPAGVRGQGKLCPQPRIGRDDHLGIEPGPSGEPIGPVAAGHQTNAGDAGAAHHRARRAECESGFRRRPAGFVSGAMEQQFEGVEFVAGHQCEPDVDGRRDSSERFLVRPIAAFLSGRNAAVSFEAVCRLCWTHCFLGPGKFGKKTAVNSA